MKIKNIEIAKEKQLQNPLGSQLKHKRLYVCTYSPSGKRPIGQDLAIYEGDYIYTAPSPIQNGPYLLFNLSNGRIYDSSCKFKRYRELPPTEITLEFNT